MKVRDILDPDDESSRTIAKRMVLKLKDKAKKANPGEDETIVQAHLGGRVQSFLNR